MIERCVRKSYGTVYKESTLSWTRCRVTPGNFSIKRDNSSKSTDNESKISIQQQVIINATKKWIDTIVIGQELCPFVAPLKESNTIRFVASTAATVEQAIHKFEVEAKLLLKGYKNSRKSKLTEEADGLFVHQSPELRNKSNSHEVTLLIFHGPFVTDFNDFDMLCEQVNHNILIEKRFFDILAVMNFHPKYVSYYDSRPEKVNDSFYYPNRSPYPTMLLVPDLEMQAAFQIEAIGELCGRNKIKFVGQGLRKCQTRLQSC